MEQTFNLSDYMTIFRRRRWWFMVPTVVLLALALAAAMLWPPTYRSSATVLIEEAEIPDSLMETGVSGYVERRLEAITRRVMVTDTLSDIIDRYGLYREERASRPMSEIVAAMRDDIKISTLSADVVNPRTGSKGQVTVAFELSFEHGSPETAQRVTNELVSLYLNENIRQRRERVTETATFFTQERERLEARIDELSQRLAAFKAEHSGSLPEDAAYNRQMLTRLEAELRDIDREEQSLLDREAIHMAQLAQIEPTANGSSSELTPSARLAAARTELSTLSARYSPSHPDVTRVRREVEALQQLTDQDGGDDTLNLEQLQLRTELDSLKQSYSEEHPDVRRVERQLASVEAALEDTPDRVAPTGGKNPSNPAYLAVASQLEGIRNQIAALEPSRDQLRERYQMYQERLAKTPSIEQEYNSLVNALQDARAQRDRFYEKEQTARLGQAIETEQRGERFSLIEPPTLPSAPEKPNRRLIMIVGLVLSMGAGAGAVALRHALDSTVTGPGDITAEIGFAPLGIVPNITSPGERIVRLAIRATVLVVFVAGIAAVGWYVHEQVIPLDTALFTAWREIVSRVGPYLPSDLQAQLGIALP